MLENRPIVQKSVYGAGAFAFVFAAAMSGTAFMITGGVGGHDDSAAADAPAYQIASNDAWADTGVPPTENHSALVPASLQTRAAQTQPANDDIGTVIDVSSAAPDDAVLSGEHDDSHTVTPVPADKPKDGL